MKEGTELDVLVAKHIMGWDIWRPHGVIEVITEDETFDIEHFKPSTDIKDAWEVIGLLHEKFMFKLTQSAEDGWWARFNDYEAYSMSAPLSICLAALKVVGVELNV